MNRTSISVFRVGSYFQSALMSHLGESKIAKALTDYGTRATWTYCRQYGVWLLQCNHPHDCNDAACVIRKFIAVRPACAIVRSLIFFSPSVSPVGLFIRRGFRVSGAACPLPSCGVPADRTVFASGARRSVQHPESPELRQPDQQPEFTSIRAVDDNAGKLPGKRRPEWRSQSPLQNRRTALDPVGSKPRILLASLIRIEPLSNIGRREMLHLRLSHFEVITDCRSELVVPIGNLARAVT